MLTIDKLRIAFEYFYSVFYKEPHHYLTLNRQSEKIADNFLKSLSKDYLLDSLGSDFIWTYTIFQFSFWEDITKLATPSGRIEFSLIFGAKALERYRARDTSKDWMNYESTFITRRGFSRLELEKRLEKKKEPNYHLPYPSPVRAATLNTETGFANCIELTTLYDHLDPSCQKCNSAESCKELLKVNYPRIYKKRGYGR